MKKLLLSIVVATLSITSFSQPFTITTEGFRSIEDTTKSFIVVAVPECDNATLFQKAKNYFTIIYNSPKSVMSESGTDAISILGNEEVFFQQAN